MKIVILDSNALNPGDMSWDQIKAFGDVTTYPRTQGKDEIIARIGDSDIVLLNKVPIDAEILDSCPSVKLICCLSTGYNVVDIHAARDRNIPVCNVPAYSTAAVSQFTFALLLELCHRIGHHDQTVHDGKWTACPDFCYWDTPQMELTGKTMGIIGFGRIGQAVGRIAKAMGMEVLAYSRSRRSEGEKIAEYVDLETLLHSSDIISLHCPLMDNTYHMINAETIQTMKTGVTIINTSRGGLIDTEALIEGLLARKIGAACLDVYEEEADVFFEDRSGHIMDDEKLVRLIAMPNVLVTSHQAFLTEEALDNIAATTVDNLLKFTAGEPNPTTQVK